MNELVVKPREQGIRDFLFTSADSNFNLSLLCLSPDIDLCFVYCIGKPQCQLSNWNSSMKGHELLHVCNVYICSLKEDTIDVAVILLTPVIKILFR